MNAPENPAPTLDLVDEINRLRKQLNAVLLAHYYQADELQDLADHVGDSLALSQQAAKTSAEVIVFCGVHFMAETAKILNPDKLVLLPDLEAGCSLSDQCPADQFAAFVARYENPFVVSYVNSSAAVKAMSDVICTSSNAVKIVERAPKDRPVIFGPDQHLGRFVMKKTGRALVLWPGSCQVHELFSEKKIVQLQVRHPEAEVVAHPECLERVLAHAAFVGSTKGILDYVDLGRGAVHTIERIGVSRVNIIGNCNGERGIFFVGRQILIGKGDFRPLQDGWPLHKVRLYFVARFPRYGNLRFIHSHREARGGRRIVVAGSRRGGNYGQ